MLDARVVNKQGPHEREMNSVVAGAFPGRSCAEVRIILPALALVLTVLGGCQSIPVAPQPLREIQPPRPLSTGEYLVGAYYFPGWSSYERWKVLNPFPERMPLLGYYQEGRPEVMDWQIKWAVEHGISFFVFDWYWDRGHRQLEHALHDGYLRSRFRSSLKFCLLWANHNPPGSSSEADLLAVLDYWIAHYFRRPEYLTVDGRPMVIIFSTSRLTADMGSQAVRDAITKMRQRARAEGFPDLFLAAVTGPGEVPVEARLRQQKFEGYDATTGYNYPRAGMDTEELQGSYDAMIEGYSATWNAIAEAGVLEYFPVTEPGWDSRPWEGEKALVRTGRHPAKFREMLRRARGFVDRYPVAGGKKIVLIEAWNEYGEGAAIEPHREWGFAYLDAVREVFGQGDTEHTDLTPRDLRLSIPQVPCPDLHCPHLYPPRPDR